MLNCKPDWKHVLATLASDQSLTTGKRDTFY